MKKITFILLFLLPLMGFAQANQEKIQAYLDANHVKLGLTQQDVSDWSIHSEIFAEGTKITSVHIVQQYLGTELYHSASNVWVKNNLVINMESNFRADIASKINAVSPVISALSGMSSAYNHLHITAPATFSVVETVSPKEIKISDGINEDLITGKLVYEQMPDNKLRLAWAYQFYAGNTADFWDVRIDAIDGSLLTKNYLTVNCSFGNSNHDEHNHGSDFNFSKNVFNKKASVLQVNSGSYRVIPFNYSSPNHSPFQLITTPHFPGASPKGWHDSNSLTGTNASLMFTITRGNNIHAQEDVNGDNLTGVSPNGGATLNFDFPYGGTSAQPSAYQNAATTNLFYMTNIMHDVWYMYGFNEASRNFQQNNYGLGGTVSFTGDYVFADAQDQSALTASNTNRNNANFSPTPDGTKPRIQMYVWTVGPPPQSPLTVLSPADIAGPKPSQDNVFSPGHVAIPIAPGLIQSDLVLYNDGTPDIGQTDNADGCGPAVNAAAISGHIAVIRRSTAEADGGTPCPFTDKVKNAQNAGAIAVIIVNNIADPTPINMSGADATITIPAISVSQAVGQALITKMQTETVNVKLQFASAPFVNTDGDFDNGIIGHEYGHGISNRLIGTGSSCMNNYEQMGEGWSDWFSLMMQIKSGDTGATPMPIATFALSQPNTSGGLRSAPYDDGYPYSTDMSINPLTLVNSNMPVPADPSDTSYRYQTGNTWATVLWDLTWAYIGKYGFDPNIYTGNGGNNKVMRLVLDALKLQACNQASLIGSRNLIIAADQATTGGADYCMITEVFRRRGMGLNATSGNTNDSNDQVEDFTAFPAGPSCTLAVDYFNNEGMIRVYPNPSNGLVNIRINQFSGKVNVQVFDINGRAVFQANNDNFNIETSIDLSHLQSGMYVLKLNGDQLNYTHKLILN